MWMSNALMPNKYNTFPALYAHLDWRFLELSHQVHTETWQGLDITKRPEMKANELLNLSFTMPLQGIESLDRYRTDVAPNLPWADDHFDERICGVPINPGTEWENWPWGRSAGGFLEGGVFNHNYMERLWPKFAGEVKEPTANAQHWREVREREAGDLSPRRGIRWEYGDLESVIDLIEKEPHSRQAWIPLFFPEDTGVGDGGRKPCTLGYQFIMREDKLHTYYPLRSCDYVRHFRDDIYLAIRLGIWVLEQLRERDSQWDKVKLGSLSMHCTSLHVFANDMIALKRKAR